MLIVVERCCSSQCNVCLKNAVFYSYFFGDIFVSSTPVMLPCYFQIKKRQTFLYLVGMRASQKHYVQ